ncbi:MAG: energy transducer TonB family protein, partial [Chitinophagaceae bacterium]
LLKPLSNTTYTADKEVIEEYGQRHLIWQTSQGVKRRMNMAPNYPKEEKLVAFLESMIGKKVNWEKSSFIPHPNEIPSANMPFEPGFSNLDPPSMPGDLIEEPRIPEIQVRFPGGEDSLKQYIHNNLVIPPYVLENNMAIRAFYEIKFAVDGRVMDVKIVRSSGDRESDMEGVKLIRRMPNWLPAQYHGERIPATYILPITFKPE